MMMPNKFKCHFIVVIYFSLTLSLVNSKDVGVSPQLSTTIITEKVSHQSNNETMEHASTSKMTSQTPIIVSSTTSKTMTSTMVRRKESTPSITTDSSTIVITKPIVSTKESVENDGIGVSIGIKSFTVEVTDGKHESNPTSIPTTVIVPTLTSTMSKTESTLPSFTTTTSTMTRPTKQIPQNLDDNNDDGGDNEDHKDKKGNHYKKTFLIKENFKFLFNKFMIDPDVLGLLKDI